MTASVFVAAPVAHIGRWLMRRSQTRFSLFDQGLVSGLGFLTGIAAARLAGLEEFGRFAVVMILAGLAQGLHNALIVAPVMSLAGTPRGRSPAFYASAVAATVVVSIPMALGVMALLAGFELAEGKPLWANLIIAAGAFALAQNLLLTMRRVLFALGRGGEGLAMDMGRATGSALVFLLIWLTHLAVHIDLLVWLLAALAAVPALVAMWPIWREAEGRLHIGVALRRCWPMAKWMLPTVIATFGQEQVVWLIVGFELGDAPVGGLRAAQYLVSLAYPFLAALENVVPVEASRAYRDGGPDRLRSYIAKIMLTFSPLACGFPLVAAVSASFWLRLFFGQPFQAYAGCLQIFALVVLFVFVRDMLSYFFRATQRTKVIFQAFVVSSVVMLLAILPLIHTFGVTGAAAGIAAGQGLSMIYLAAAALRARRPSMPHHNVSGDHSPSGGRERPARAGADLPPLSDASRLAVVVASVGRPADVAMLLDALKGQSRPPDMIVVSVPEPKDAPAVEGFALPVVVTLGVRGLPAQRNAGLRAAADCDVVAFFDDDFLPAEDYLEHVLDVLSKNPNLLAVDGHVVFDGAVGPGLEWDAAAKILASAPGSVPTLRYDQPDGLYGCNMCYRTAGLGPDPFDEKLPLYAWLEDYDLSRRLAGGGHIGRVMAARGVHLGVKRARASGLRMGYSQIANPLYLLRKGTMPFSVCARHLLRRPLGNAWGALRRDRHVDRRGRLRGNMIGLFDAVRGRISPDRILQL